MVIGIGNRKKERESEKHTKKRHGMGYETGRTFIITQPGWQFARHNRSRCIFQLPSGTAVYIFHLNLKIKQTTYHMT